MIGTPEQVAVLKELMDRLVVHQGTETPNKFAARFGKFLGSDRTYGRMVAGDFGQVNVPKKIESVRSLLTLLEQGSIPDEFYDDLPFFVNFSNKLVRLEGVGNTDRRILCVLGAVGVGKTMACHRVTAPAKNRVGPPKVNNHTRYNIIVPEALRENKLGLLSMIASSLGCMPAQVSSAAVMEAVKSRLAVGTDTLIFDEAHQGGVMLMRIIKDLVNVTQTTKFLYVALRTEYIRVISSSKGAITEAKQFIRRCVQPVYDFYATGTKAVLDVDRERPADAALLLKHKTDLAMSECKRLANDVLGSIQSNGNLSTLSDAIDQAARDADDAGSEISYDLVKKSIEEICGGK